MKSAFVTTPIKYLKKKKKQKRCSDNKEDKRKSGAEVLEAKTGLSKFIKTGSNQTHFHACHTYF